MVFIKGTSAISPQHTFDPDQYLLEPITPVGPYFKTIEPNYREFIDPKLSRRMARVIKMGVATAMRSLDEAGRPEPQAIITGTGLGCLTDTEKFMQNIVESDEGLLSPTSFIQSTHNTIGGQIALLLKCYQYNFTYVHRGLSFESGLHDAMMQIDEGFDNILVGGVDEATDMSYDIMTGMQCVQPWSDDDSASHVRKLPHLGEGAAYFVLSGKAHQSSLARLNGLRTFYNTEGTAAIISGIKQLLSTHNIQYSDIDVFLAGTNGIDKTDRIYYDIKKELMPDSAIASFKNLCGEYHTSSAFALNLAVNMIRRQEIFPQTHLSESDLSLRAIRNILIMNHYKNKNFSLMLLSQ